MIVVSDTTPLIMLKNVPVILLDYRRYIIVCLRQTTIKTG